MDILFLLPALLACFILTGIHAYLGIHVISRGVIFVDIALAQIAALGMTVAFLLGFEPGSEMAYCFALGFTSLAAIFFSSFRHDDISQEALIGVSFAVSSALAILIADQIPHGSEHLKYLLSGNILWVTWPQIAKTSLIYAAVTIFHYRYRRPLLLASTHPEQVAAEGGRLWVWDLLFYLSFGLVITSSVQIAGILLVFSFLIVPSLCSMLFCNGLRRRLTTAWLLGIGTSTLGIACSYYFDLPTGPSIVALFGGLLFACLMVRRFSN